MWNRNAHDTSRIYKTFLTRNLTPWKVADLKENIECRMWCELLPKLSKRNINDTINRRMWRNELELFAQRTQDP